MVDSRVFSLVWLALLGISSIVSGPVLVNGKNGAKTAFVGPKSKVLRASHERVAEFKLVPEPTLILDYHNGPVMTGKTEMIKLFVVLYGDFAPKQRLTLRQFFKSFWHPRTQWPASHPTVEKWWQITRLYVDLYNIPVARNIVPTGEIFDSYSLGKSLNQSDIQDLVVKSMGTFGADARAIYLILTAEDVMVESFCNNVCGTHFYTFPSDMTSSQMVPYGWVGNAASQCPSMCAWPYAPGGTLQTPLVAPNGDPGIDGMIITIANILAGMATNPYGNAFYQGDAGAPLETAGACQGEYGIGAFPGYPGQLLVDNTTGASFNVFGAKNFKFLVPWIWHPTTLQCAGQV